MKLRTEKVPTGILVIIAIISLGIFYLAESTLKPEQAPYYKSKLQAAHLMSLCENSIKDEKHSLGISIDPVNDPNKSGLIGNEYTLITTDRGRLQSKLLATNPNFAAVVVGLFKKAGLNKGDKIAVGFTGSLPGMNLAVMAAIEALKLEPIIITSLGASMWGANDPNLTWLDIERILNDRGILHHRSVAASIGGGKDKGQGLSPEGRELIREATRRNKIKLIEKPTLEQSIKQRMAIYDSLSTGNPVKAYVNVGGGIASLGSNVNGNLIPPGLSMNLAMKNFPKQGAIVRMAQRGIPIIHLLEIEKLAKKYDIPTDPNTVQEIGEGKIYFSDKYSMTNVIFYTIALCLITFLLVRVDLKHYLLTKQRALKDLNVNIK